MTLFATLLQLQTTLLPHKPVCFREENMSKQIEKPYVPTVLSAVPTKITP